MTFGLQFRITIRVSITFNVEHYCKILNFKHCSWDFQFFRLWCVQYCSYHFFRNCLIWKELDIVSTTVKTARYCKMYDCVRDFQCLPLRARHNFHGITTELVMVCNFTFIIPASFVKCSCQHAVYLIMQWLSKLLFISSAPFWKSVLYMQRREPIPS